MVWEQTLVTRLRYVINDFGDTETWTDTQLQNFIALSATKTSDALGEFGFPYYDVVFATDPTGIPTITPDPTGGIEGTIIVLGAAQMIASSELRKKSASAGFRIVDDKSTIDTKDVAKNLSQVISSYKEAYDEAVDAFKYARRYSGEAILAPYAASGSFPHLYRRW